MRTTIAICAAVAFSAVGCNGKVDQCNKLVEKINAGQKAASGSAGAVGASDKAEDTAKIFDKLKDDTVAVKLEDAKLKQLQDDYAKWLADMAVSLRAAEKSMATPDASSTQQARADFDKVANRESQVVDAINKYCRE